MKTLEPISQMNAHQTRIGMLTHVLRMGVVIGALTLCSIAHSDAQIIVVDPDAFSSGTLLNTAFAGVTLSNVGQFAPSGDVFSATNSNASTGTRAFAQQGLSNNWHEGSALRADFAIPTNLVSLDFIRNDSFDPGELRAFNSSGTLIATESFGGSGGIGSVEQVQIIRVLRDIAYIRTGGSGGNNYDLDNLRFHIPEPSTFALASLGLLAMGSRRRKRA